MYSRLFMQNVSVVSSILFGVDFIDEVMKK